MRFDSAKHGVCLIFLLTALCLTSEAIALPPLGMTQLLSTPDPFQDLPEKSARVGVFDGVAYVSTSDGIFPVDSAGVASVIAPSVAGAPPIENITRVVEGPDSELYYATNYESSGTKLFRVSDPSSPLADWTSAVDVVGIDSNLRGIGETRLGNTSTTFPAYFLPSGAVEAINDPPELIRPNSDPYFSFALEVSSSSHAIGSAFPPNAPISSTPGLLYPDGTIEILHELGGQFGDIADREDGSGLNVGFFDFAGPTVRYGAETVTVVPALGTSFKSSVVFVSESDFVTLGRQRSQTEVYQAYFPGANPSNPSTAVLLLDLFPELTTIDFEYILDVNSSSGQLHMLLSGDDGLWLFAARDPSFVPAPGGSMLLLVGLVGACVATQRSPPKRSTSG